MNWIKEAAVKKIKKPEERDLSVTLTIKYKAVHDAWKESENGKVSNRVQLQMVTTQEEIDKAFTDAAAKVFGIPFKQVGEHNCTMPSSMVDQYTF
jgi:hypothetical protein